MRPFLIFLLSFHPLLLHAKVLNPSDGFLVINNSHNNPMIMNSKNNKKIVKIDRSVGFYDNNDEDDEEKAISDSDIKTEEYEVDTLVKSISLRLKDDLFGEKKEKEREDFFLDNDSLEDADIRYKRLIKIDATPKEPSDDEDAEISIY